METIKEEEKSEGNLCEIYKDIDEVFDRLENFKKGYYVFTDVGLDVDKRYIEILHQKIDELKELTFNFYYCAYLEGQNTIKK